MEIPSASAVSWVESSGRFRIAHFVAFNTCGKLSRRPKHFPVVDLRDDSPYCATVLHPGHSGHAGLLRREAWLQVLGTWQDPPVYAIVVRDQQAIHLRCAEPPTANPNKYGRTARRVPNHRGCGRALCGCGVCSSRRGIHARSCQHAMERPRVSMRSAAVPRLHFHAQVVHRIQRVFQQFLTTDAGHFSTTSPAAIWLATWSGKNANAAHEENAQPTITNVRTNRVSLRVTPGVRTPIPASDR